MVTELDTLLADDDPRWHEFGLSMPSDPDTPEAVESLTLTPNMAGKVVARNESLEASPELVNSDPYGEGWLFEIVPSNPGDMDGLMDASSYQGSLDS